MRKCFVVMPFGEPFDDYYQKHLKPTVESLDIQVERADEVFGSRPIINDIIESIIDCDFILADVSLKNPNVNYELGIAHALKKPVIIISQKVDDIPFDYRHIRAIIYDNEKTNWENKLKTSLKKTIEKLLTSPPETYLFDSLEKYYSKITSAQLLGVSKAFYTRQNMNTHISELWKKPIAELDIIAFGLRSFRDAQSFRVEELLRSGLKMRILTINPNSDYVKRREIDENTMTGQIRKTIIDLNEWADKLNKKSHSENGISIKYYDTLPLDFYWRQNEYLFVGPYLQGIGSQQTLTYEITGNSEIGAFYKNYFDNLWNDNLFAKENF
jgi:hypothetical protein